MSAPAIELTTTNSSANASGATPPFQSITLDRFLEVLAGECNITIKDGLATWDTPASQASVVARGQVTGVPVDWTWGDLAVSLMKARLSDPAVALAFAKVAIHKAHQDHCTARASQAAADAARLHAEALIIASLEADQEAEFYELNHPNANLDEQQEQLNLDASDISLLAGTALVLSQELEEAADLKRSIAHARDEMAVAAIKVIPAPARQSFVATLAPEFAHLAGDMEPEVAGRQQKPSFSGLPRDIYGFACTNCKTYNLVRSGEKNWFAVYVGKKVGIVHNSAIALSWTSGVPGGHTRGFFSLEEAEASFADALIAEAVRVHNH